MLLILVSGLVIKLQNVKYINHVLINAGKLLFLDKIMIKHKARAHCTIFGSKSFVVSGEL